MKPLPILLCVLLMGCAQGPLPQSPSQSKRFDALHPGGPVYAPTEIGVPTAPPAESPFGTAFANDRPPAPASLARPYWINACWGWKDPDWEWIPGRWVELPKPGLIWISARHYAIGARNFWVSGYWD